MSPPLRCTLASLALVPLLGGCGFIGAGADPLVFAFRGGAGYWPENSRHALSNALLQPYDGIQIDVAVTGDGVPVLHRGPWLSHEVCTEIGYDPNTGEGLLEQEEVLLMDFTFEELEDLYRCGGLADPSYPDVQLLEDGIMPFEEALQSFVANPGYALQFNVIYDKGNTPEPAVIAQAILDLWYLYEPDPPYWFLSAPNTAMIKALDTHAASLGRSGEIETSLVWPRSTPEGFGVGTVLGNELAQTIGLADVVGQARSANSDGIALPHSILDRQMARKLQAADLSVHVWGADSGPARSAVERWPVDVVITAYPEPAP